METLLSRCGEAWHPYTWEAFRATHVPKYRETGRVKEVCASLETLPGLVSIDSILQLKESIARCSRREGFILHTGDCVERFSDSTEDIIDAKVALSKELQMLFGQDVISIERMGGQYAKPRSSVSEGRSGRFLPSYFGDLYNGLGFSAEEREVRPERMLEAYRAAQVVLGSLDAHYTSHEALNLYYEAALTREREGLYFNLSTHLPWLGMRTALSSLAHVEYLRGIENPIGIKIGPLMTPQRLLDLLTLLNPHDREDKILLITRLGADLVDRCLPGLLQAVQHKKVVWLCDAVHGNTEVLASKYKVRRMENILKEIERTFEIHRAHESYLAGLHLETTWEEVTECLDEEITEEGVSACYRAIVDSRLNPAQARRVVHFAAAMKFATSPVHPV